MRKNASWFDTQSSGDLISRLSGDIDIIQGGISENLGLIIQALSTLIFAFTIAFIKGIWFKTN